LRILSTEFLFSSGADQQKTHAYPLIDSSLIAIRTGFQLGNAVA